MPCCRRLIWSFESRGRSPCSGPQRLAERVESSHGVRPITNGDFAVQMLVNRHRTACQGMPKTSLVQLPTPLPNGYRVVLGNHTLALHREDAFQIRACSAPEGRALLGGLVG